MKYLKNLVVLLLIIVSSYTVKASHYMGGEITWQCIPAGQPDAGKFTFILKVYRECGGIDFNAYQTLNGPMGNIPMSLQAGWPKDLSPTCYLTTGNVITCAGAEATGADNTGAVSEFIYVSAPIQLSGIPPVTGWVFSWASSARNPADNTVGQESWYLRAKMYPYNGLNAYPCFDNSPSFSEVARSVISAGYPFEYNHNAYDKELDSLAFEWGVPMKAAGSSITYAQGYSYNSPLPGPAQNSNNIAATVDPLIGTISFTSYTTGAYVTSVKVSAYRCGQKVAEIWRDIQVVLLAAGSNLPPIVNPPLNGGTTFSDVVYAGEVVSFALNAQDIQFLPDGTPQTMEIEATGAQFGSYVAANPPSVPVSTFSETIGCLQAPCATLTPAPNVLTPVTGVFGVQTQFYWQTECDHLAALTGCGVTSNIYNFVIKVLDNYCPAPAMNYSVITITILPKPYIPSPDIQCLSVLPNGDVSLEWSLEQDSMLTFDSYRIYYNDSLTGVYTEIDSIFDYNILNYTHVGANALDSAKYYYVKTISGCPGFQSASEPDTFSTINVEVSFDIVNMNADVSWNATHNPVLATSTGWYKIYRKQVNTNWEFVDSTQNTFFTEAMKQCDDEVQYYVTIEDTMVIDTIGSIPHSCISTSSIGKALFYDFTAPEIPVIDTVSIDNNSGNALLSWDVSSAGDAGGYIIYLLQGGGYTPIDTVYGKDNNSYIDLNNNPCGGQFNTYTVAAIDTCVPPNVSPYSIEHSSMSLNVLIDICEDKNTLTWTPYVNMDGGLSGYKIYASENGGPAVLLNTNLPVSTTYEHIGLVNGATYDYYIVAESIDGSKTSTSCLYSLLSIKPGQPEFLYVRKASVSLGNSGVDLVIHTDTAGIVSLYRIERSDDNLNWTSIATLTPNYLEPTLSYTDATASVGSQSYYYRCIVVDSCGKEAITSLSARTIFAVATARDSLINQVSWLPYLGFDGSPTTYQVYRGVDGVWDWNPILTLPETQTFFNDDISSFADQGGVFNYLITAYEGPGTDYRFNDTVYSNTATVVQQPRLYIPTAFNPTSTKIENRIFVPTGVFVNSADYLFVVYNRWGTKVFETTEVGQGWDGTGNGIKLPGGVYTYFIRFTASNGVGFEDRGTITMMR